MALIILEIPGVIGESQVQNFENRIVVDTFGQDAELEMEITQNARRTIHVPKINNLTFERKFDNASAELMKRMLLGKVDAAASKWVVHCLKSGGDTGVAQVEFLTVELINPLMAKHTLNVSEGDTTEQFEVNAVEIYYTYHKFDHEQKDKGVVNFRFNTLTGKVN